jgi:hypothetical protein
MVRPRKVVRSPSHKPPARRLGVEALEHRLLLCGDIGGLTPLAHADFDLPALVDVGPLPAPTAGSASGGTAAATNPLGSIPALNSLPGAPASLYLDFDGYFESQWGSYRNVSTPAFDQDGDPTTFSDGELAAIREIWGDVAEDFAPFNLNVTTVPPASFANGVALRVAVGGDGAWAGGGSGGMSYIDSFTNSAPNTSYVFAKNLGNGYPKYVADAISHEAGHAFGLQHQSQYAGTSRVAEYYGGPGDGRAPLMGNSYGAARSVWWYGTSTSSATFQDDMAVIARPANGFGYRPDEAGDTAATATPLTVSGNQVSAAGVIFSTADLDYFSFTTSAGTVSLAVNGIQGSSNLDARLELRDAGGTLLAAADPGTGTGAGITATVAAGTYYLVVASHGAYGDVGQYTVSGTIVAGGDAATSAAMPTALARPAAPSNLLAVAARGRRVSLRWQDNSANESGFVIQRSANGGRSWVTLAQVGADVTFFSVPRGHRKRTCLYRVYAYAAGSSGYSNVATAR